MLQWRQRCSMTRIRWYHAQLIMSDDVCWSLMVVAIVIVVVLFLQYSEGERIMAAIKTTMSSEWNKSDPYVIRISGLKHFTVVILYFWTKPSTLSFSEWVIPQSLLTTVEHNAREGVSVSGSEGLTLTRYPHHWMRTGPTLESFWRSVEWAPRYGSVVLSVTPK